MIKKRGKMTLQKLIKISKRNHSFMFTVKDSKHSEIIGLSAEKSEHLSSPSRFDNFISNVNNIIKKG